MLRYAPMTKQANSIRIIAGTLGSRKISFPDRAEIRPTGDRIRETLFNWIQHEVDGSNCLDLFAGSGALGIEALSRGAKQAVFVEMNSVIAAALTENLQTLRLDNCEVCRQDALQWIASSASPEKFNIVFLDPPFDSDLLGKSCSELESSARLVSNCLIYIEQAHPVTPDDIPSTWSLLKEKKAGNVFYCLYKRNA